MGQHPYPVCALGNAHLRVSVVPILESGSDSGIFPRLSSKWQNQEFPNLCSRLQQLSVPTKGEVALQNSIQSHQN